MPIIILSPPHPTPPPPQTLTLGQENGNGKNHLYPRTVAGPGGIALYIPNRPIIYFFYNIEELRADRDIVCVK